MRVNTLRIPVRDLVGSQDFYREALGREPAFGNAEEEYVGFFLDNVTVLLEAQEPGGFEAGRYLGFSLEVPDVRAFYDDAVARDIPFAHPPEIQPWGGIMTHVIDPDGNVFSVIQMEETQDPGKDVHA
ncbi:MAG: VOC family protein [Pseudomonadales bacterium]|nr:VOC family protein [Pseudomonadales bacterium]